VVFEGIPRDAVRFYGELEQDNSKEFWARQQQRYAVSVREPLSLLVEALAGEFGEPHVYRPQRDLRFSHDKRPYKDHQGAVVRVADGMGWYVEVGAGGLATAGGVFRPAPDQVERLRRGVDDDHAGERLRGIVEALAADGFDIGGEQLRTRPRGVAEDHPRLELMRHKSLTARRRHGEPVWLCSVTTLDRVRADWRAMAPLVAWLTEHVGPSTPSTTSRRRR
jgi:uncharacterized protein (TIGR02453 family)